MLHRGKSQGRWEACREESSLCAGGGNAGRCGLTTLEPRLISLDLHRGGPLPCDQEKDVLRPPRTPGGFKQISHSPRLAFDAASRGPDCCGPPLSPRGRGAAPWGRVEGSVSAPCLMHLGSHLLAGRAVTAVHSRRRKVRRQPLPAGAFSFLRSSDQGMVHGGGPWRKLPSPWLKLIIADTSPPARDCIRVSVPSVRCGGLCGAGPCLPVSDVRCVYTAGRSEALCVLPAFVSMYNVA